MSPENLQCKTGMNQSPIDISHTLAAHVAPLESNYPDSPEGVLNNGHTVQAMMAATSNDTVTIDGKAFRLQQFHFHAPSENTLNGKHAAMELHLVHKNAEGELAVVAVMFNVGVANDELTDFGSRCRRKLKPSSRWLGKSTSASFCLPIKPIIASAVR